MDRTVPGMEELKRRLLCEKKMKYNARAERDRAIRKVDQLAREVKDLRRQLEEARTPFKEEHDLLVEAQLENIRLKRQIMELEEGYGLPERNH